MRMTKSLWSLAAAMLLTSLAQAEDSVQGGEVAVPAGQQAMENSNIDRPRSGLSMDQVNSRYGSPSQKVGAVGTPPISRWVYDQYTVYFEYDHVIHSVLNSSH